MNLQYMVNNAVLIVTRSDRPCQIASKSMASCCRKPVVDSTGRCDTLLMLFGVSARYLFRSMIAGNLSCFPMSRMTRLSSGFRSSI